MSASTATDAAQDDSVAARARRKAVAAKHAKMAAAGIHLPSIRQLLLGMCWHGGDLATDAKCFAERILPRVSSHESPVVVLARDKLAELTALPDIRNYVAAAQAFRAADLVTGPVGVDCWEVANRCDLYAAASGDRPSCIRVAELCLRLATVPYKPNEESGALATAGLGWLAAARQARPIVFRSGRSVGDDIRHYAAVYGNTLANDICAHGKAEDADEAAAAQRLAKASGVTARGATTRMRIADIMHAQQALLDDGEPDDDADPDAPAPAVPPGIIVIQSVGAGDTSEGRKAAEFFNPIIGVRLPLTLAKDLAAIRETLAAEFPHAVPLVDAILGKQVEGQPLRIRPTVLIGEPGVGKTAFARRMLTLLTVPCEVYPCAGASDSAIAGTARRWSTGEPSLPLGLIRRHRIASPGIILDEVQRSGSGRHNGNLQDALVCMIEPESAAVFHDLYAEASVDISKVIWLATANDLDGVPAVVRDRCALIRFPTPGPEHMGPLAAALLKKAVADQGHDVAWARPLDGVELDALAEHWSGGSLRKLGRLVAGVLAARDQAMARA